MDFNANYELLKPLKVARTRLFSLHTQDNIESLAVCQIAILCIHSSLHDTVELYLHSTYLDICMIVLLFHFKDVMSQVPIEEVLMGMASQLSEREDALLCSDVRDNLFGPMEFSRRDLGALNIMRGRDNGLPDYNTARYRKFKSDKF